MKSSRILIFALILVLVSSAAWAQRRFEITPFVGYRTSGGFDGGMILYQDFHFEDGLAYGVGVGYRVSQMFTLEAQWSRSDSALAADTVTLPQQRVELAKLTTDVYHANFLFYFRPEEYKLRPYFMFGLGATVANPKTTEWMGETVNPRTETRFSWNFGLGVEAQVRDRIGFRVQARWLPTYINSTSGYWYDWWGNVWLVPISNYMNQFEFTGGLTFRF